MNAEYDTAIASLGNYGVFVRRVTGLGQVTIAGTGVAANDIWPNGGLYPWMTGLTTLEVVSSSANDSAAGTGARTVTISGLDATYTEISSTVTMNGTTAVVIPIQFLRVNSISIASNGTSRRNEGTITVRDSPGGTARSIIPIASVADLSPAISKQAQYTVPANHTLLIYDIDIQINSSAGGGGQSKGADVLFYFASSNTSLPIRLPRALTCTDIGNGKSLDPKTQVPVLEKTDFGLRASYTSAAGVILSGSWEGLLFRRTA